MKKVRLQTRSARRSVRVPGFVLSRRIMILSNLLKRAATIRYRRLLNLRPGEWGVVAALGERSPRNLVDLAAGMGLDKGQISRSVSSLVRQGLATRGPNPRNSREILIALTPRGRAAYQSIVRAGAGVNDVLLAALDAEERRHLRHLLDLFTSRAQKLLAAEQALGPSGSEEDIAQT
jgi:DNA-binding MarR family transcriptional regulator